jgi:broad specificity phosphatase PhoE
LLLEQLGDPELRAKLETEITTTEDIAEWGYGDYEGLYTQEIRELRKKRGLDQKQPWDIWRDGTEGPGSESAQQVADRLDRMISTITKLHGDAQEKKHRMDIVVVAHGHILRAFVKRWLGLSLDTKLELMLEPGGVCGLSYAHGSIDERAVLVGMSFPGSR